MSIQVLIVLSIGWVILPGNNIMEEMNEYSSANSAEYWMGNTTR